MAQKLIRCEAGHIFDSAVHARCPECGEVQEESQPTRCARGHAYDSVNHESCPTCQAEDQARLGADTHRHDSDKGDDKKGDPPKTGLWLGLAAGLLALVAGGGYFVFQNGSDDQTIQGTPREKATSTTPAKKADKPSPQPVQKVKKEEVAIPALEKEENDPDAGIVKKKTPSQGNQKADSSSAQTTETRSAAEGGNAEAQYQQGLAYEKGQGAQKDPTQAVAWYRKAADQGHAKAEYRLGLAYKLGRGINQDHAETAKWFQRAAQQGLPDAQNDLGVLYAQGKGVARDDGMAARWYQKAAAQGNKYALTNLGYFYAKGKGVPKDEAEAVKLYTTAAEQGHASAQFSLAKMYEKGEGVRQNHTEAAKWLEAAAKQGHKTAQNDLGVLYWKGLGVSRDFKAAAAWFQKAADQGLAIAQGNTGNAYARGQGVEQNPYEALKWYRAAVKNGYVMQKNQIGKSGLSVKTSSQLECNGIGLELKVTAGWNGQSQTCTLGATHASASGACSRVVGTWGWSSRGIVTIAANGTMKHTPITGGFGAIGTGKWSCSGNNQIVLTWDGGQFVDQMTLSDHGNRLSGKNNLGWPVTGIRQYQQRRSGNQPPPGILPPTQRRTRR